MTGRVSLLDMCDRKKDEFVNMQEIINMFGWERPYKGIKNKPGAFLDREKVSNEKKFDEVFFVHGV